MTDNCYEHVWPDRADKSTALSNMEPLRQNGTKIHAFVQHTHTHTHCIQHIKGFMQKDEFENLIQSQ